MITVGNKRFGARGEYVGRPTALGNPFVARNESERDHVCDQYERWLRKKIAEKDPAVCAALNALYKKAKAGPITLVCWCAPRRCHADSIKRVLEEKLK